jgi:hypothetical protein
MKVDMSSEAVTARLKLVSQLRRLCLALGKARPVDHSAIADPASVYERSSESTYEPFSGRPRRSTSNQE